MAMIVTPLPNCCAVGEIRELQQGGTPHEAMKILCNYHRGYNGTLVNLDAHIVFSGVEETTDTTQAGYGGKFAKFIKDNKLGTITESEGRYNLRYHKNHLVKVWVWSLDADALRRWWSKENEVKKADVA